MKSTPFPIDHHIFIPPTYLIFRILPNFYCATEQDDNVTQYSLLKADMSVEERQYDQQPISKMSTKEKSTIEANLAYIVRKISETLTGAKTKYLIVSFAVVVVCFF